MTSEARLTRLLDYDFWANSTLLEYLTDYDSFEKREQSLRLFYHIIGTHHHWFRRVTGAEFPDTEIWPELRLEGCQRLIEANHQRWAELVEEEKGTLDQVISYRNSQGIQYESSLGDIMHHLIIHGQHHRSQIALLMRMSDIAPPATDFIFYTREVDG
ncbi:DinB family protein [Halalkalibaculum sp. DA3122]|uniref:DinB family protein n=1 Tax=unclassified Halalkalibaculum TaxID=2964617 RepID=UPI003754643B